MGPEVPVLFTSWERTTGEILDRTMRFPKSVRFTFSVRIDNLALEVPLRASIMARHPSRGGA